MLKEYGLHIFVLMFMFGLSLWIGVFVLENIYISTMLIILSGFLSTFVVPNFITATIASGIGLMGLLTIWGTFIKK